LGERAVARFRRQLELALERRGWFRRQRLWALALGRQLMSPRRRAHELCGLLEQFDGDLGSPGDLVPQFAAWQLADYVYCEDSVPPGHMVDYDQVCDTLWGALFSKTDAELVDGLVRRTTKIRSHDAKDRELVRELQREWTEWNRLRNEGLVDGSSDDDDEYRYEFEGIPICYR
jgi:hypothetical protein